jgi:hypothetical protein
VYQLLDGITGGNFAKVKGACKQRCKKAKVSNLPTYTAATSPALLGTPGGVNGVKSYNILENPELQIMFGISPAFAAANKGLASVASFSAEDAIKAAQAQALVNTEDLLDKARFEQEEKAAAVSSIAVSETAVVTAPVILPPPAPATVEGATTVTNPMHAASPSAAVAGGGKGPAAAADAEELPAPRKTYKSGGLGFVFGAFD